MPRGSDESWVGKLNEKCAKYKHFGKSRFGTTCECCDWWTDDLKTGVNITIFSFQHSSFVTFRIRSSTRAMAFWRRIAIRFPRNW